MAFFIYLEYKRHDTYANAGRALCNPERASQKRGLVAWYPFSVTPQSEYEYEIENWGVTSNR
jgi:hypothetical protein